MYKIDWSKIKNGYRGFELLAVRYVQMEYNSNFTHTPETRDGNKDAYLDEDECTIIVGYQPTKYSSEQWWMEAKYSKSEKNLTRYRLDATLVSAILKGNVSRIIFVTNIDISSHTMNDIRQAISNSTICRDVDFCTRDTLEYWLYENTSVLKEFFDNYEYEPIELQELMLINGLEFFNIENNGYVFKESLRILNLDETYSAICSVYSKASQKITLRSGAELKGILIRKRNFCLHEGINYIKIIFTLKSTYGYKSKIKQKERTYLPEPYFILGNIEITSRYNITINSQTLPIYQLPSQRRMFYDIKNFFNVFNKQKETCLFYLYGESGTGKSHVLDMYIKNQNFNKTISFIGEMTGSYHVDLNNLISCINFIYFPFLPSDNITKDYLNKLDNNCYLPPFYYKIINCCCDEEPLSKLMYKYLNEDISLFPQKFCINPRLIIIDDIHKANNLVVNILYKMIMELSIIHAPFQFIFIGQYIQRTSLYSNLYMNINICEKNLRLSAEDCLQLLPGDKINDKFKLFFKSNCLFSNIIELLSFVSFIKEQQSEIHDLQSFQILYSLFFKTNIMDLYLKRLFQNIINNDSKAAGLCNEVYWSTHGIKKTNSDEEMKLLCCHLIKLDSHAQKIIPYHDLYTKCYRKNYSCNKLSDIPLVQLLDSGNVDNLQEIFNKLQDAYKKQNYILVYYTLEPIYKDENTNYRNLIDENTYYTLFYIFAHSCAFCGIDYSGAKLFRQIYEETSLLYNPSPQIKLVKNSALWELTNSTFESLDYTQALKYCESLLENTLQLVKCGIIRCSLEESKYYHNANVIKCMVESELQYDDNNSLYIKSIEEMIKHGKIDRLWSFRVRYSLTLMQRKPEEAIKLLNQCCKHYKITNSTHDKYYLWTCFYLSYLKTIVYGNRQQANAEADMLTVLEEIKEQYFNDYRKMLFGVILYLYYSGQTNLADLYLLKDCYVLREKRPRLKGFEHLIHALRYTINNDNSLAVEQLNSAYNIFKHIPSYASLILHNINLINDSNDLSSCKIKYYLGGDKEENTYYLDIRGCW